MNPKETITKIRELLASYETESIDLGDVNSIRYLLVRLDEDIDKMEENIDELQEEVEALEFNMLNVSPKMFEDSQIADYLEEKGYFFFQRGKPSLYDVSKSELLNELYKNYSLKEIEEIIEIKKYGNQQTNESYFQV